jgi:exopolyphosphatase/guanosine-5'-triphosphate,3'-diphosphate pyrophosphatase
VLCGLGTNLGSTGRLDEEGVERALAALKRFRLLAKQAGADEVFTLATAAARDAENGPAFVRDAKRILEQDIHVLTGAEEAEFAAYGIVCGFDKPEGISADMGGGSVEFMSLDRQPVGKGVTLPLGGLRLQDDAGGDVTSARKIAKKALSDVSVLKERAGETFYAVGGTWRAMGRLHMAQRKYPLHVMHNYEISTDEALKLCKLLIMKQGAPVHGISGVSANRRPLLPFGAVLLEQIIKVMKPSKVVFSALGVREGYLYCRLPAKVKKADPLITAAEEMAVLRARSPAHARELVGFTQHAFAAFGLKETGREKRFRKAACLFADITWRSHPDYRGAQALNIISNANIYAVDHPGRAYLALASYYRHEGLNPNQGEPPLLEVAGDRLAERSKLLGALFRVGYLFSAAMPGVLPHLRFEEEDGEIVLNVPKDLADLEGERPEKRLRGLAEVSGKTVRLAIS